MIPLKNTTFCPTFCSHPSIRGYGHAPRQSWDIIRLFKVELRSDKLRRVGYLDFAQGLKSEEVLIKISDYKDYLFVEEG